MSLSSKLLNCWWHAGAVPPALLEALVVSLYKKGDPRSLENYRPISLLSAFYNIYAGLIKVRLESGLEKELSKCQFGFRRSMSTSQAIFALRRSIDWSERSGGKMSFIFLDWEKAFNRIRQGKLLEVLRRYRVPELLVKAVASLYVAPSVKVRITQVCSEAFPQSRGIRQGCPPLALPFCGLNVGAFPGHSCG